MKKKIVIASEEDVARYAGGAGSPEAPPSEAEERGADVAAPQPAQAGPQTPPVENAEASSAASGSGEPQAPEDWKDKCLRARAELANVQRRFAREKEECLRYAAAGMARGLLSVLDDLERVIRSAHEHPENVAAIVDGVKLTREAFLKVLAEHQVAEIEAVGRPFDPAVHEAMMQQTSDEHPDQTVLQELSRGYRLHDRVLRPARVVVSRRSSPSPEESPEAGQSGQE